MKLKTQEEIILFIQGKIKDDKELSREIEGLRKELLETFRKVDFYKEKYLELASIREAIDSKNKYLNKYLKQIESLESDLNEATKILSDGCLVYDQHVTAGSSSFRVDADSFIEEIRQRHGLINE